MKKKWYGKVKMKTYMEDVETEEDVNLDFALSSKFIPLVYGVQRVSGLPFFVDTKSNDPNNVYIAYALCEGEIGGIYDLYIDGNPLMCLNAEDYTTRNTSNGTAKKEIEVHCRGRVDRGDTLGGVAKSGSGVSGSSVGAYTGGNSQVGHGSTGYQYEYDFISPRDLNYYTVNEGLRNNGSVNLASSTSNGTGVKHEETISLTAPNDMEFTLHTGKIDQRADDSLVSIATSPGFKRQNDYFTGEEEYWSPNHQVLDTAYVVMDCEIAQDVTTVPEVEYVVRGKNLSCFNYDYSYAHSPEGSGEDSDNFKVGDIVTLYRSDTDASINADVFIIDKWTFQDPDGTTQTRFRYSDSPALSYSDGVATIKQFYMKNSSNQTWTQCTFDFVSSVHSSGTVPETLDEEVTVNDNGDSAVTVTFDGIPDWLDDIEDYGIGGERWIAFIQSGLPYQNVPIPVNISSNTATGAGSNATSNGITAGTQTVISPTAIKLASAASSTDDAYNNYDIVLKKTVTDSEGITKIIEISRTITDYDGGTKIATVNMPWTEGQFPLEDDTYELKPKIKAGRTDDARVSINPAMQLLDYCTAQNYGKGLVNDTADVSRSDISLADWLLAARTCDSRGTQTYVGNNSATVGQRYVLTSDGTTSGTVVAMGKCKAAGTTSSVDYTTFEEMYGKFTKRLMLDSHYYSVGDVIYVPNGTRYYRVTSAGYITAAPSHTSGTTSNLTALTSVPLFLINSSGTITGSSLDFSHLKDDRYLNPCRATDGSSGYSLYDSDNIKYWRYLGWDAHHQRYVTRHQTQGTVNTADSVFSNINGFLKNFNGLLSYESGKYALRIEVTSDTITSTKITAANTGSYSGYTKGVEYNPRIINNEDIIGNIKISDAGPTKSYNTVSTSIMDPANMFKGRSVTFYDSNYLREDKNVVKTGSVNIASVINIKTK